jgi:hypothetical protein
MGLSRGGAAAKRRMEKWVATRVVGGDSSLRKKHVLKKTHTKKQLLWK